MNFQLSAFGSTDLPWSVDGNFAYHEEKFTYKLRIIGPINDLKIPANLYTFQRQNNLWKSTCFEIFFLHQDGTYLEFNFSPSGQWNSYYFEGYRKFISEQALSQIPEIIWEISPHSILMTFSYQFIFPNTLKFNPALVMETQKSETYYWSCNHQNLKPDFHYLENFIDIDTSNKNKQFLDI